MRDPGRSARRVDTGIVIRTAVPRPAAPVDGETATQSLHPLLHAGHATTHGRRGVDATAVIAHRERKLRP